VIARAASKIPWDKLLKVALPVIIDETKKLVAKISKRKPPEIDPNSTPEARINTLETYVEEIEEDLKEAVKALEKTATELSALAAAGRVLTARVTISLVVSGSAAILGIGCWIFVLLHR
jgi:ATP/maltotriose-dependent transcriptional regulator MalT